MSIPRGSSSIPPEQSLSRKLLTSLLTSKLPTVHPIRYQVRWLSSSSEKERKPENFGHTLNSNSRKTELFPSPGRALRATQTNGCPFLATKVRR
jgi:hypothetical protein